MNLHLGGLWDTFLCVHTLTEKQQNGMKYKLAVNMLKARVSDSKVPMEGPPMICQSFCWDTFHFNIDSLSWSVRTLFSTFLDFSVITEIQELFSNYILLVFTFSSVMFNFTTILLNMWLDRAEMHCASSVATCWKELTIVYRLYNTFR